MIAKIVSKSFATLFRIRIAFLYDDQRSQPPARDCDGEKKGGDSRASAWAAGLDGIARRHVPTDVCYAKREQCETDNSGCHANCFEHQPKPQKR